MQETNETKPKKKGFFTLLKDSITKSNEGCGPGCGCHATDEKKEVSGGVAAKDGREAPRVRPG